MHQTHPDGELQDAISSRIPSSEEVLVPGYACEESAEWNSPWSGLQPETLSRGPVCCSPSNSRFAEDGCFTRLAGYGPEPVTLIMACWVHRTLFAYRQPPCQTEAIARRLDGQIASKSCDPVVIQTREGANGRRPIHLCGLSNPPSVGY